MEPITLELINFGRHRQYKLDYKKGITGVVGANGRGKSTLVDPAQYFAITGNTPPRYTKDSFLHWKADEGKTVFKFSHNNETFTLTRQLHKAKARLSWKNSNGENKELRSLTGINKKMVELLGMPFDIFRETCFAPQGSLADVINMRHSDRVTYFQRITGLKRAEELRTLLQTTINNIPVYPYLEKKLKEAEEKVKEEEKTYMSAMLRLRRVRTKRREMQEEYESSLKILEMPTSATQEARRDILQRAIGIFSSTIDDAVSRLQQVGLDEQSYDPPTAEERDKASKYASYADVCRRLKDLTSSWGGMPSATGLRQSLEISIIAKERASLKKALVPGTLCPTCGKIAEEQIDKEALQEDIKKYTKEIKELRIKLKTAERISALETQAEECRCEEVDLEAFRAREEAYAATVQKLKETKVIRTEQHKAEVKRAKLEAEWDMLDKVQTVHEYEKVYASKLVHECDDLDRRIAGLEREKAAKRASLAIYRENLSELLGSQARARKLERLQKKFERARDNLHRECLPKLVMSRIIYCLNDRMEFYLSKFNTNFSSYLADDFDFKCDFLESGDANKSAFTSLSGGQKVALALAFRFALADVLGSTVPLLVLDEPTVHLDETNVEAMCDVFAEARSFAETGVHIFISTHEPGLQKAFTRTLTV